MERKNKEMNLMQVSLNTGLSFRKYEKKSVGFTDAHYFLHIPFNNKKCRDPNHKVLF